MERTFQRKRLCRVLKNTKTFWRVLVLSYLNRKGVRGRKGLICSRIISMLIVQTSTKIFLKILEKRKCTLKNLNN
jgi:hypothetical protein